MRNYCREAYHRVLQQMYNPPEMTISPEVYEQLIGLHRANEGNEMREQKIILVAEDGTRRVVEITTQNIEGHSAQYITDDGITHWFNGETNRAGWPVYYYELPEEVALEDPDRWPEPVRPIEPPDFRGLESILREDLQQTSGVSMMHEELRRQQETAAMEEELRQIQQGYSEGNITDYIRQKLDYLSMHGIDRRVEPTAIVLHPRTYSDWVETREMDRRVDLIENTRGFRELIFIHHRWNLRVIVNENVEENEVRLLI